MNSLGYFKAFIFKKRCLLGYVTLSLWDIFIFSILGFYIFSSGIGRMYQLVILLVAIILHELAHGYVALLLGDPTAKQQGRLTFNPLPHLDPMGSVVVPLLLLLTGAPFFIGWAKPVPVNPSHFRRPLQAMMWVALAGPLTNIVLMLVSIGIIKYMLFVAPPVTSWVVFAFDVCQYSMLINCVLAIFNLLPIPPLDGSRIITAFLPKPVQQFYFNLEPYGMPLVILCAIFGVFTWVLQYTVPLILNFFF